jgi:Ca-activated chloride channel homolog
MKPLIKSAQEALKTFLERSHQQNEYFVMAFNSSPELLLDWTSDSRAVVGSLGVVRTKGNTAFYDACYLALDKVRHGRHSRQVLIVISDGVDTASRYTSTDVRDELKASDVMLYSLNPSGSNSAASSLGDEAQLILDELSSISGGRSFYQRFGKSLTASDAASAFEIIAEELRHQYTIAVTPNVSAGDSKFHKVQVKVQATPEMKHLTTRQRAGFYLNHR